MSPADKVLHFIVGAALYFLFSLLIGAWALIPVFLAAVGKELYDSRHPDTHSAEIADAAVTIIGGLVAALLTCISI